MSVNNNQLQATQGKLKFSVAIQTDAYKKLINNTLGDPKRANKFIAAISSAVSANPQLQQCDAGTILSGALLGEALGLSPSPQLGHYFLVKYDKKEKINGQWQVTASNAQFQLGYKGYIQLAIRSGQYKDIDVLEIHEGEYLGRDKATGKQQFEFVEDDDVRDSLPIVGYLAYFELINGFRKQLYWTKEKMEKHALKYSQGYKSDKAKGTNYTFWTQDFDGMAFKTMLRQLISKWGVMSIELQNAFESDMAIIKEDGTPVYVDNADIPDDTPIIQTDDIPDAVVIDAEVTGEKQEELNFNDL